MNIVGSTIGAYIGVNLINGKIKLKKKGIGTYIGLIIFCLLFIAFSVAFIYGLIKFNFEFILFGLVGSLAFCYLLLISPYTQNSKNYFIKVQNSNSFEGFELYYKNKKIDLKYDVDNEGKFKWKNNNEKLNCISYSDNSKMNNIVKYKIINYFSTWLLDNNFLSEDVRVSFEKL